MLRLQKFIALATKYSRRKAENFIEMGKVKVNGRVAKLGDQVESGKDQVELEGQILKDLPQQKFYIKLNKPAGYVCSMKDPHNPDTVLHLLPEYLQNCYPVGRLDKETTGLLLLTNDGDFAQNYTHPSLSPEKEYLVEINGVTTPEIFGKLKEGLILDGYKTRPVEAKLILQIPRASFLSVILKEGRNRQIRECFKILGKKVLSLKRIRIGEIKMGGLREGEFINLTNQDQNLLPK